MFVACEKIMAKTNMCQNKDPTLHSNVLQELRNIMYDKDGPSRVGVEMWAMSRLQYVTNKYLQLMPFGNTWKKIGDIRFT
jgi:hypothetical protein